VVYLISGNIGEVYLKVKKAHGRLNLPGKVGRQDSSEVSG
jgi:hypothetical protein